MEYVILGFLLLRSLTQYDLYKALKEKVSPFYQPSLGSIQSTLKKLEVKGYITVEKVMDKGRRKNNYTITESGSINFRSWMQKGINESRFEAETSTKLFFLGLLSVEERKQVVGRIIAFFEVLVSEYEEGERRYQQNEFSSEYSDVVKYQFKTLSLGIFHYRNTLRWFQELLREMEGE